MDSETDDLSQRDLKGLRSHKTLKSVAQPAYPTCSSVPQELSVEVGRLNSWEG